MPKRTADATWNGDLQDGNGRMSVESGSFEGSFSFTSRFEEGEGTNPEELIAASHAGCYSMALSNALHEAGYDSKRVTTSAEVNLDMDGPKIDTIHLDSEAEVPGIDREEFLDIANDAKENCPVSKLLAGADITLEINLV